MSSARRSGTFAGTYALALEAVLNKPAQSVVIGPDRDARTHTEAVVEFEGAGHKLRPADGFTRGQSVWVDMRRGRLSGQARFVSLRLTAPVAGTQADGTQPEPWIYDPVRNRHWNPVHGHWHDGPAPGQR